MAEEAGSPAELVDRLDLDEDVVFECCRVLADWGLAERMGASRMEGDRSLLAFEDRDDGRRT